MRKKNQILKFWCLEKNQENYCHTTKHFTLQWPQRVIYYLNDKEKSGHEDKILKQDLECFWKKFSTLINARLSDLRGTFVQGMNVCGTSQRDAMDQEKNPAFILVYFIL